MRWKLAGGSWRALGCGGTAWARTHPGEQSYRQGGPLLRAAQEWRGVHTHHLTCRPCCSRRATRTQSGHRRRVTDEVTHSRPYTNTDLLGRVSCTQGRACTLTRVHPPGPTCQDRHRRTQTRRCTRARTGVQRPGLAAMHMASRALASLPPDDSGSAVPVSRAAAGQPSSDRSDGRAHLCLEEALAASASRARGMMKHSPGLQVGPQGVGLSLLHCCLFSGQQQAWGRRPCFPLASWRPALLCLPGSRSLLGPGGRGVRELSVSLGVPGICAGLSGFSACLPVCGSLGTAHRPFPMTPALSGMGPLEAV